MKRLFTTTALGLVLAAAPAMAQTNETTTTPPAQTQPQTEQMNPSTGEGSTSSDFKNQPDTGTTLDVRPPQESAERPLANDSTKLSADYSGYRASELIGATVVNAQGETVGEINDIILASDGTANAALIGVGGFLGIGEKNVAVEFTDLNVQETDNNLKVSIAMSAEALEAMPAYKAEGSAEQSKPDTEMKKDERAPEGDAREPKTKL